jgi:hypothetical protein
MDLRRANVELLVCSVHRLRAPVETRRPATGVANLIGTLLRLCLVGQMDRMMFWGLVTRKLSRINIATIGTPGQMSSS